MSTSRPGGVRLRELLRIGPLSVHRAAGDRIIRLPLRTVLDPHPALDRHLEVDLQAGTVLFGGRLRYRVVEYDGHDGTITLQRED